MVNNTNVNTFNVEFEALKVLTVATTATSLTTVQEQKLQWAWDTSLADLYRALAWGFPLFHVFYATNNFQQWTVTGTTIKHNSQLWQSMAPSAGKLLVMFSSFLKNPNYYLATTVQMGYQTCNVMWQIAK